MGRQLKTWTALGLAALGTASLARADGLADGVAENLQPSASMILAQAESDADGEGGGEGGGSLPSTYALASQDVNAFSYDAKPQVEAYIDLVRSSYARAAADAAILRQAVGALLAAPSQQTLDQARAAWVAARPSYLRTEAFRFYDGPIEDLEGGINSWPVNEAYIDYVEGNPAAGLINDPSFKIDAASLAGANQKQDEADVTVGWHAIEFLLWGQDLSAEGPGNRPYTDYTAGQGNNDRRRDYLRLVTEKLVADLDSLAAAWADQAGTSYAARLSGLPQREVLGRMINGMAILAGFEFMSERLAVALDSGDQEDEHSCFSDTTKQDFVHDLLGIRQVWTGDADGKARPGLDELLRGQDPELASRVDALFADAEAKVNALGDPWDQVLASPKDSPGRQAAEQAVASLQALADGLAAAGNRLGVLVLIPSG
jgi:putative iron-regulated protein